MADLEKADSLGAGFARSKGACGFPGMDLKTKKRSDALCLLFGFSDYCSMRFLETSTTTAPVTIRPPST